MKKTKYFLGLNLLLIWYSMLGIFSKLASKEEFFNWKFVFYYGVVIIGLFLFAIFWQQILKVLPLVTVYSNKSITIVWGIIWGKLFFMEEINIKKIISAMIIIAGIFFIVVSDNISEKRKKV